MFFSCYLNSFKQDLQSIWNTYKLPLTVAFAHFILSSVFQIDRLFFDYNHINSKIVLIKLIYLTFLAVSWCFIFHVKWQLREKNPFYIRAFRIFSVYLSICLVLMVIIWPGTWSWDDFWTLYDIKTYRSLNPWQHILSGLYLDVLLNIIPFPGGAILLQVSIISIIVAYVITKLEYSFTLPKLKYSHLDIIIKCLPFLLPPILLYQYSGYRIGLYMYLELCTIVMLVCTKKDSHAWSKACLYTFALLCILISTWRSEAAVYFPLICATIFFVNKNVLATKNKIKFITIFFLGFLVISFAQKKSLGNENYLLISISNISTELVHHMDREKHKKELAIFDKFIPIEIIDNNPTITGTEHYWRGNLKPNNSKQDLKDYLKSIIKLSVEYPYVVINERNRYFWGAMQGGLCPQGTVDAFDNNSQNQIAIKYKNSKWFFKLPFSVNLRKTFLEFYFMRNLQDSLAVKVLWNNFIPTLFILLFAMVLLITKHFFYSSVFFIVLSKILIIYLTSPAPYFMYFVSYYLLGYTLLVFTLYKSCSILRHTPGHHIVRPVVRIKRWLF